jgi:hypothetical protein
MADPASKNKVQTLEGLSDLDIEQIFAEIENAPPGSNELPEELRKELEPLFAQLRYVIDFVVEDESPSFVGRVFVGTTMDRTTTNHFLLVVDETEATAFFRRLGHQIASQSDTQNGLESPNLISKEALMKSSRRDCERGRKVLDQTNQSHQNNSSKLGRVVRSRGLSYREWDGKDCYFDHSW